MRLVSLKMALNFGIMSKNILCGQMCVEREEVFQYAI